MSWIRNLYETYEACAGIAGSDKEGVTLVPVGHTELKTNIEIHIDINGTFLNAVKDKGQGISICAPCSDDSEGRTIKVCPHALFDQLKYIAGDFYDFTGFQNRQHYISYKENLKKWVESEFSHPKILAIYDYIKKGTVIRDLINARVYTHDELRKTKKEGSKNRSAVEKDGVRFTVYAEDDMEDRVWMDKIVQNKYLHYLSSQQSAQGICYASGKMLTLTENHPKKINPYTGNAKLISSNAIKNDKIDFVYRGRFHNAKQAVSVSYEISQKAHQALRWLISSRGYRCDTQAIVAWAVDEVSDIPKFYDDSYGIYESIINTDSEKLIEVGNMTFIDYGKWMKAALNSSGNPDKLKTHARRIVVMATDATTKNAGRMSITYYRELHENEYLERITNWHDTCKWYQIFKKEKDGNRRTGYFIGAPSVDRIIEAVLGKKRKRDDKSYDKMKRGVRERLLHCILDGERVPLDMVNAALHRASNPIALENRESKNTFDRWYDWEQILCAACALIKRYYHDYKKEEYDLELEESRTNRDYLYGRLLAIADAVESSARYKQGNAKDDIRATNAIRYMTAFSQHPFRTWSMLWNQLNPYIQQLHGADWYLTQIGNIKELFGKGDFESNASLDGMYLLGFFAQRQKLRPKKQKSDQDGGENNEFSEQN